MSRQSLVRRISLWSPPLIAMAVIYGFSSASNPMPVVTAHVWDKVLHTLEYGGLALLFARAVAGEGLNGPAAIVAATLLASAYGATDEYHQSFVPDRCADAEDWLADTVGAALGAMAYAAYKHKVSCPRTERPSQF